MIWKRESEIPPSSSNCSGFKLPHNVHVPREFRLRNAYLDNPSTSLGTSAWDESTDKSAYATLRRINGLPRIINTAALKDDFVELCSANPKTSNLPTFHHSKVIPDIVRYLLISTKKGAQLPRL